jgi:hypothetical protein
MHIKDKNCPSPQCIHPSSKCSSCNYHNNPIPPIPFEYQSNIPKISLLPQISSSPTSSYQSSKPLSSNLWNSQHNLACLHDTQSILSFQRKCPPISCCQPKSSSFLLCRSSSYPISSCRTCSPFPSTQGFSSFPCSPYGSSKCLPQKHVQGFSSSPCSPCGSSKCSPQKHKHSPKCAKGELQDPPCPSQQYQLQHEDHGASIQKYIPNDKPKYPPSSPPSLYQPDYTCESKVPCLPSMGVHNCCCGKCKSGEEYEMKNPKRCFHCGKFHSCCCGMCLCPNTFCPRSPNYGHNTLSPISISRQEKAFKYQEKMPTRPIDMNSQSPQKRKFKDHYVRCCISQDSRSRGRSYPHNTKNCNDLHFFQHNSNAENYVLQPLSVYKTRPQHKATTPITQCQSRAQWSPIVWSPMIASNSCCCQRCFNGEPCTSKSRN